MNPAATHLRSLLKQALSFAVAFGIWLSPIPAGLTKEAWHLFAIFAAAIFAVILNAFPLLTASLLAVAAAVLTRTVDPGKAFAGFANSSVLLVVVAFLVANAVVKSGLGSRISLLVVSVFGRSTLGLGYSIFLTDAMIAPAFPSNTARGGVLYPIILSLAQTSGSMPDDQKNRRMGGYLMFCGMASLSLVSPLAHRHLRQSNRGQLGGALRREDQLWFVVLAAWFRVDDDRLASPDPLQTVSAGVTETPMRRRPHARPFARWDRSHETNGSLHGFCIHGDRMGDGWDGI
jgi:hypothetical protein